MSDLTSTSCGRDNGCNSGCDNGISPIMILLLLSLCGGNSGFLGGCNGNNECGCNGGLDGILPIILLLSVCGGSF